MFSPGARAEPGSVWKNNNNNVTQSLNFPLRQRSNGWELATIHQRSFKKVDCWSQSTTTTLCSFFSLLFKWWTHCTQEWQICGHNCSLEQVYREKWSEHNTHRGKMDRLTRENLCSAWPVCCWSPGWSCPAGQPQGPAGSHGGDWVWPGSLSVTQNTGWCNMKGFELTDYFYQIWCKLVDEVKDSGWRILAEINVSK